MRGGGEGGGGGQVVGGCSCHGCRVASLSMNSEGLELNNFGLHYFHLVEACCLSCWLP